MDPRAFYESSWQQPFLLGLIGAAAGGAAAWSASTAGRGGFLARWTQLFALAAIADCVLTGYSSPLGQNTPAMTAASVFFVILGDLRLYLLTARFTRAQGTRGAYLEALVWALAPSLLIAALKRLAPWTVADGRHIFLTYELAALVPLGLWWAVLAPQRLAAAASAPTLRWLRGVLGFFAAQYALWALADVGILRGAPLAWALRVAPNAMYYGLFVCWAWFTAPPELRR